MCVCVGGGGQGEERKGNGGKKSEFSFFGFLSSLNLSLSLSLSPLKDLETTILTIHDERRARDAAIDGGRGDRRGALGAAGGQEAGGGVLAMF